MTRTDVERVQTYLRRLFDTDRIRVVPPAKAGLSVELTVADEVIGTVHRDEDEGEVSYSLHITILEEDLLPAKPADAPAPARGRPAPRGR
jgi:hypothetical protein